MCCQSAQRGVNHALRNPWNLNDTREDLKLVNVVQIRHCFREVNSTADCLTKKGVSLTSLVTWWRDFPVSLDMLCIKDLL